ncbi:MAG TPA: alcohol dehydrogenase catalytic domain-containing protein, partial [Anaerolineae bacterium]
MNAREPLSLHFERRHSGQMKFKCMHFDDEGYLMKAIVFTEYGSPDVLRLIEVEKPAPTDNQLLIKVHAASVNPLDLSMRGPVLSRVMSGGLFKPKVQRLGVDLAGTVEAVGSSITQFKPGDEVFG